MACAVLASLLLPGGALLLGGCQYRAGAGSEQALRKEEQRATAPDQVSRDVAFFIYEDDQPRALVEAQRMERYEREDSTYTLLRNPPDSTSPDSIAADGVSAGSSAAAPPARRVTAYIYRDAQSGDTQSGDDARNRSMQDRGARSDSVSATIRANQITYLDADRRFEARGRVVVTTAAGKRLESEHLAWLEEERRITTPGFVNITTPTDRIQGYGLNADENLDAYRLGRVTGQVTVEDAS